MRTVSELKKLLVSIREHNWRVPEEINSYMLALESLDNIGSTDSELRDDLILSFLNFMIQENVLTDEEVKHIVFELILSENHLFYNIGSENDDSVFNRSFSVLLLECALYRHNATGGNLFKKDEIIRIYENVIKYLKEEKDVRGYVRIKGWAHSVAHTGDVLAALATFTNIGEAELTEILEEIRNKISINYYAYVNNEEERLIVAVISVMERKVIGDEKIINWIKSFHDIGKTGVYPEDHNLICNHKGFLSALYFRLKRREETQCFLSAIEEVINNMTPKYFY